MLMVILFEIFSELKMVTTHYYLYNKNVAIFWVDSDNSKQNSS